MPRLSGNLLALAKAGLICALLFAVPLLSVGTVEADSNTSGTTVITAHIAPVRYILVSSQGQIIKILSNCQANVTPVVYRGSFSGQPMALTPGISSQYRDIMARLNTKKTGVIYQANYQAITRAQHRSFLAFVRPR